MIIIQTYNTCGDMAVLFHYHSMGPWRSQTAPGGSILCVSPHPHPATTTISSLLPFLLNASTGVTIHSITSFLFDRSRRLRGERAGPPGGQLLAHTDITSCLSERRRGGPYVPVSCRMTLILTTFCPGISPGVTCE